MSGVGAHSAGFFTRHCQSTWAGRKGVKQFRWTVPSRGWAASIGSGFVGGAAAHGVKVTFIVWLARDAWPEGVQEWQKR
jgi:hypothetical protein